MGMKSAFLLDDVKEDVYMRPPASLISNSTFVVCKLHRSLYGLKQAPRAWYAKFTSTLLKFAFSQEQV